MKNFRLISFFLILLNLCTGETKAQDGSRLRISLLTCTPGDELYSIFGHTAIRVVDSNAVSDLVFNYGTFEFNDDFYFKFVRGKLNYYLSVCRTGQFIADYQYMRRGITEQLLDLNNEDKQAIYSALMLNCKEENKYYQYDFFLDNCTTRIRDLLKKKIHQPFDQPFIMPKNTTFRHAIHQYLEQGGQAWSEFGIDLLLGAKTDRVMTASEQEFLPDNLMNAVDANQKHNWVSEKSALYPSPYQPASIVFFNPLTVFGLVSIGILFFSFNKNNVRRRIANWIDFLLFFSFGIIGIVLFLAWFFTDHSMTKNNYNLIWALPTHFIFAFLQFSTLSIRKYYFLVTAILMSLLTISWFFLPQMLPIAVLPLVIVMALRSFLCYKNMH